MDAHSETNTFEDRMKAGWMEYDKKQRQSDGYHSQLGEASYWDELYSAPEGVAPGSEVYDWLLGWSDAASCLQAVLEGDFQKSIVHLGCGNSKLPEEMCDAGYGCQTCVDVSSSVIGNMRLRNSHRPIRWIAADCTDLSTVLADGTFDCVIDKSALDAIMMHDQHAWMIIHVLKEAFRITKLGGFYVCISLHDPEDMLKWLQRKAFGWTVQIKPLGTPKAHKTTAYICKKVSEAENCLTEHWPTLCQRVTERPDSDVDTESDD